MTPIQNSVVQTCSENSLGVIKVCQFCMAAHMTSHVEGILNLPLPTSNPELGLRMEGWGSGHVPTPMDEANVHGRFLRSE